MANKVLTFKKINGVIQLPKAFKEMIEEAAKYPPTITSDCPRLTDEQLAQFKPRKPRLAQQKYTSEKTQTV